MRQTPRSVNKLIWFLIVAALAVGWWRFAERAPQAPQREPPLVVVTPGSDAATTLPSSPALPLPEQAALPASADVLTAPSAATVSPKASLTVPFTTSVSTPPVRAPPERIDGLPVITLDELPPEALDTLALIERGGPFPFRQDGTIFQNRERLLPLKPAGYYREYTVITPGASTRGARRIVAGAGGELYYTDDHYASFRRIWKP